MAKIIAVHGIAKQFMGEATIKAEWLPALRDGLKRAGGNLAADDDMACAFYGDLFRPRRTKAHGDPPYDASDVDNDDEKLLLELWWKEAAEADSRVPGPDERTRLRTPRIVQRSLNALSNSPFFAKISERALIGALKQVMTYFHDDEKRALIRDRVENEVGDDTRIVIGHSLGSVVAYEVLAAHSDWPVKVFVTLGSPLGIPNLIFDRLQPPPSGGVGQWPGGVEDWVNIADAGDIVALVKELQTCFGERVQDRLIYNGSHAHDATPYLTSEEVGEAVKRGL